MIAFLFSHGGDIEALCKTADRREGHDTVTPLVEAVMSDQAGGFIDKKLSNGVASTISFPTRLYEHST